MDLYHSDKKLALHSLVKKKLDISFPDKATAYLVYCSFIGTKHFGYVTQVLSRLIWEGKLFVVIFKQK